MRELRTDPTTGDAVILSTDRVGRPHHLRAGRTSDDDPARCPFCPGNEGHTPPTLAAVERGGAWVVRAFPNRYPALGIEGALHRRAHGPYDRISGTGAHEVIVETREHSQAPWRSHAQMTDALRLGRDRMRDLARDGRFRSIAWFRNHGGEAGATLGHPHAQIIAMPTLPPALRRMCKRFERHWRRHERELMQDLLDFDLAEGTRVVFESQRFVAICPWAPRTPFEVWLVPVAPAGSFLDADDGLVGALADAMSSVLAGLDVALEDPPYNACLFTAPLGGPSMGFRWHVRIYPRIAGFAGFEVGTGATMHGVPPETAAEVMRSGRHGRPLA